MKFYFITNNPKLARYASDNGADRIFVDLERLGKQARQGHLNTLISEHSIADIARVRRATPHSELVARLNPLNESSAAEIDQTVSAGADTLILPMFSTVDEVAKFVALVNLRARIILLAETAAAIKIMSQLAKNSEVSEVHIGLNDLSLDLQLGFMFEPLALGLLDDAAATLRREGKPFGIGGVARTGEGVIPAEMLMCEHVRLGSSAAILSRTFHRDAATVEEICSQMDFAAEICKLRDAEAFFRACDDKELKNYSNAVRSRILAVADLGARQRLGQK